MLNLSEEELKQVEEFAGLCFTPEQIAVILEKDEDDFLAEFKRKSSVIRKAYNKGALIKEAEVRKSIFELAKSGSSSAQQDYIKLMNKRDTEIMKKNG
jgi:hypothetical protein